jgi:hypothetical protein
MSDDRIDDLVDELPMLLSDGERRRLIRAIRSLREPEDTGPLLARTKVGRAVLAMSSEKRAKERGSCE